MRSLPPLGSSAIRTLSSLGVPTRDLARDTGRTDVQMLREIRRSGGIPAGSAVLSKGSFQRILKHYAELERRYSKVSEDEREVLQYLRSWLRIEETTRMVQSLSEALNELTLPGGVRSEDRPYREFLIKVFEDSPRSYAAAYTRWRDYVSSLADHTEESIPSSHEAWIGAYMRDCVAEIRSRICPSWPSEARECIEYALGKALSPKALSVVRPFFGLGVATQSMKEIAAGLQIPVSTARARCNQALKVLKHCAYTRELRPLVRPVPLKVMVPGKDPRLATLCQPVDVLNLSVRTSNCLFNASLYYIGQVVQCKGTDLLKTGNFGRKSLKELSGELAEYGDHEGVPLSLDTIFDPEFKAQLDQELEKLPQPPKFTDSPSR